MENQRLLHGYIKNVTEEQGITLYEHLQVTPDNTPKLVTRIMQYTLVTGRDKKTNGHCVINTRTCKRTDIEEGLTSYMDSDIFIAMLNTEIMHVYSLYMSECEIDNMEIAVI